VKLLSITLVDWYSPGVTVLSDFQVMPLELVVCVGGDSLPQPVAVTDRITKIEAAAARNAADPSLLIISILVQYLNG
jgi:hypothetical protein